MRATLLFIRQSILVHKIANKIRFIFAISLLIFSFSLKSQSNFNNGIDRLITFEPNWGGVSLKVFSRDPNVEDIKISSRFFNPRIGFFLFKNTELGFGYTFIKVKSNHPSVQPGKAYALGYFLRYHLSFLNFWQGTNKKGKKVPIQFNLKNAQVQHLVEDLLDTLTAIERYKDPKTSLAKVKKEILG